MITFDDIPDWIEDEDHEYPFFLTLNKSTDGTWCAGYVALDEDNKYRAIIGLNNFATLDEIPARLYYAIERYKKRGGFDDNEELRARNNYSKQSNLQP